MLFTDTNVSIYMAEISCWRFCFEVYLKQFCAGKQTHTVRGEGWDRTGDLI